jgi:hypothetical protein
MHDFTKTGSGQT